jgi:O-antigen ligase
LEAPSLPQGIGRSAFAFFLFLLANAALYLRPADLLGDPDLQVYLGLMIICLLISCRPILEQLMPASLGVRPITVSLLGLLACVALSHLSHLRFHDVLSATYEFSKLILYYLLLVAVVDSTKRLNSFLTWFVLFVLIVSILGFLQYCDWIDLPALQQLREKTYDSTSPDELVRITSVGIFNNPNDLARILVIAMPLALYVLVHGTSLIGRCLCGVALPFFGYILTLTYSRGGFLGLLVGIALFIWERFGWKKSLFLLPCCIPLIWFLYQGRQTEIDISEGTGQQRILIWSEGLQALRDAPLFGIGYGEYAEQVGLVAHNSFVQSFVELGFLGGCCFLAAFYIPLRGWLKVAGQGLDFLPLGLRRAHPYFVALFAGYGASLLSSTRIYTEQSYLVFGLATVYFRLAEASLAGNSKIIPRSGNLTALLAVRFATRSRTGLWLEVLVMGFMALVATYLFIRFSAQYGYRIE